MKPDVKLGVRLIRILTSIDAFYQIAAFLCDINETDDIKSDSTIHDKESIA